MENIIPIRDGYYAVIVPKDASNIGALNATLYWYAGCPESMGFQSRIRLIGILGESITEDQAREIYSHIDFKELTFSATKMLIEEINLLGIKTENPLKRPEETLLLSLPPQKTKEYLAWEASERELKKIVILKTTL